MITEPLTTVDAVVVALGGTRAVADLTGATDSAVSNWRKSGTFPARTYIILKAALGQRDAPDSLWSMICREVAS